MKSPIKWVGSKKSIVKELIERLPPTYESYNESFFGGGTLFFELKPNVPVFLSDKNERLIITFQTIRDNVDDLISELKFHKANHCKEYYLEARERFNVEQDKIKLAALFVYLNKTCYNGLYRVSKRKNEFNVPMGSYKKPAILDIKTLQEASLCLRNANISVADFRSNQITQKSFYYFDPPYHNAYNKYTNDLFGEFEQQSLAAHCMTIHDNGGFFMLSNSDTPFIRELYKDFYIESVSGMRKVSCKSTQRRRVDELLIRNF